MNRALGEAAAVAEAGVDDMMMNRAAEVAVAEVAVAVVEYPMKRTLDPVALLLPSAECLQTPGTTLHYTTSSTNLYKPKGASASEPEEVAPRA